LHKRFRGNVLDLVASAITIRPTKALAWNAAVRAEPYHLRVPGILMPGALYRADLLSEEALTRFRE